MKKRLLSGIGTLVLLAFVFIGYATASTMGAISTDRFGYTGIVQRYNSLVDAQNKTDQVDSDILIGNRDLSLFIVNDLPAYYSDFNAITGAWWYTIIGPDSGYGNTTGNSGRGFLQLYDGNSSTDTSLSMAFTNYNGTFWTDFSLSLSGVNANYPDDYARFWVDYQGSGADKVLYHNYQLNLTASGLEGTETSPGIIEAFGHPTSVVGTYSGIFENVSTTIPANNGFYAFDLVLDMDNWAFTNENLLVSTDDYDGSFANSYFAAGAPVPEPATMLLFGFGLLGVAGIGRRKK